MPILNENYQNSRPILSPISVKKYFVVVQKTIFQFSVWFLVVEIIHLASVICEIWVENGREGGNGILCVCVYIYRKCRKWRVSFKCFWPTGLNFFVCITTHMFNMLTHSPHSRAYFSILENSSIFHYEFSRKLGNNNILLFRS